MVKYWIFIVNCTFCVLEAQALDTQVRQAQRQYAKAQSQAIEAMIRGESPHLRQAAGQYSLARTERANTLSQKHSGRKLRNIKEVQPKHTEESPDEFPNQNIEEEVVPSAVSAPVSGAGIQTKPIGKPAEPKVIPKPSVVLDGSRLPSEVTYQKNDSTAPVFEWGAPAQGLDGEEIPATIQFSGAPDKKK